MFLFGEVASPPAIHVVDIGAMLIGDEDWLGTLGKSGTVTVTGFEPQPVECEKLNKLGTLGRTYLPYAIGDGTRRNFYVTNSGMTSSLLEPDLELQSRFRGLAEYNEVVSVQTVDTVKLDSVKELQGTRCDVLKVDTQGSELEILRHADRILDECVLVQTEVEFIPLYKQQPLFAEVDLLMRKKGFMFHRFLHLFGRTFKPLMMNNDPYGTMSQQLWSDAVYVPDLRRLPQVSAESLLKLAAVLHDMYGALDLCHVVLSALDARTGSKHVARYVDLLRRQGEINAAAANAAKTQAP